MRYLFIIFITFCMFACANTQKTVSNSDIVLDPNLIGNDNTAPGWIAYGLALKAWTPTYDESGEPDLYEREVYARSKAASIWQELLAAKKVKPAPELDDLSKIHQAGYMREYVWRYIFLSTGDTPENVDLAAFEQWMSTNLPEHVARINTGVLVAHER